MGDLIDREAAIAVANAETWEYPQDDADAGNNYAVSRIVDGLRALPSATQAGGWMPIDSAPRDRDLLVWFDHEADPYQDPEDPNRLTDYATWAEGGDFLDGRGWCIARWFPAHWEAVDEYDGGYWLPAWWFAHENGDYERVVNPTHWKPLDAPLPPAPEGEAQREEARKG